MQVAGYLTVPLRLFSPGSDAHPLSGSRKLSKQQSDSDSDSESDSESENHTSGAVHYLYMRKHEAKSQPQSRSSPDGDNDEPASVFVANLPHDTTVDNIRDVCRALGGVVLETFVYQGSNRGLIQLLDNAACDLMLKEARRLAKAKSAVEWSLYGPRGSQAYVARNQARFPSTIDLQEQVDSYMAEFAEREELQKLEAAQAGELVDDEGFTLVVNPKRKSLADIPSANAGRSAKRKKTLEKADFYRFQLREHRKQEMNALLRRYQEDKLKVEELKQKKMLRPY